MFEVEKSLKVIQMGDEMDESALERQLNVMGMYDEFDDCRHLVEDLYDYGRQNRIRSYHVEVALEIAYGDYLQRKEDIRAGQGYEDRLRKLKVDVLASARDYVADMVHGRRSR